MIRTEKYQQTAKEKNFLDRVVSPKYNREIIKGYRKFMDKNVPEDMRTFYSEDELSALAELEGTERDIEKRMPVKMTRHYFELAKNSQSLQGLIKASPDETYDLSGEPDPAKQMDYSPVEGLLHKYELGLIYVTSTCSAHCRYCYREELIARKKVTRPDGTVAPKGLAQIPEIVSYIMQHNRVVAENDGIHPDTGREKLREILMSGGDPLVLSNKKIAEWLSALAEAGIESIRIGTKELSFFPARFDETFFDMLDDFHECYPETDLRFMTHFNHPDEFLKRDENGQYIRNSAGGFEWLDVTRHAVKELRRRNWINIDNQAPIIKGINCDADALRIMQRELKRNGVENHYFFCGRDIVGHKAFNVPIEEAWQILNESQKALSGVEAHARLAVAHFRGKIEIVSVSDKPLRGVPGSEDGFVIFKLIRSVADAADRSKVTIVGRNPEAIWFSGYADRVIFDEAEIFTADEIITTDYKFPNKVIPLFKTVSN